MTKENKIIDGPSVWPPMTAFFATDESNRKKSVQLTVVNSENTDQETVEVTIIQLDWKYRSKQKLNFRGYFLADPALSPNGELIVKVHGDFNIKNRKGSLSLSG